MKNKLKVLWLDVRLYTIGFAYVAMYFARVAYYKIKAWVVR